MQLFTIGFTKKDAETFFELLDKNNVKRVLDIRLNNSSQLAGFAKGNDLKFFLKEILHIDYIHDTRFTPTKELFDKIKSNSISREDFEKEFYGIMKDRNIKDVVLKEYADELDGSCLLCSEDKADKCHRRLVAEYIKEFIPELEIVHL